MTINQFEKELPTIIASSGCFNPDFIKNPAFVDCISAIQTLISELKIRPDAQIRLSIEESGKRISFSIPAINTYADLMAGDEVFTIDLSENNTLICTSYVAKEPISQFGPPQYLKEAALITVTYKPDEYNCVVVTRDSASIFSTDKTNKDITCFNSQLIRRYDKFGVNTNVYHRSDENYHAEKLAANNFNGINTAYGVINATGKSRVTGLNASTDSIPPLWDNYYSVSRESIDVASVDYHDYEHDYRRVIVPLNGEHGYRNMIPDVNIPSQLDYHIVIEPLSPQELGRMIRREINPIAAQGLSQYLEERQHYYHDSEGDQQNQRNK